MTELALARLGMNFCVHRFDPAAKLPHAVADTAYCGFWRSPDELSVICPDELQLASQRSEGPFAAWRIPGTLDFALTGIINQLTGPLRHADIPVFVMSTFDTDYLLVPIDQAESAEAAFRSASIAVLSV